MKVLITGSKGFIGTHLMEYLSKKRYEVIGYDRIDGKEILNLTEKDIENVDCVVHLAGQTNVWNTNYKKIYEDNVKAFKHILNLCKSLGKKFVYAGSSCSINITSMYGITKRFQDIYAKKHFWYGCVGLRLHNVYGKNSRKDTLLGICLSNDEIVLYNNGQNKRHFTYIDDVCRCIEKSFYFGGGFYNVYNPEENTVEEFVDEVSKYKSIVKIKINKKRKKDKKIQKVDKTENLLEDSCDNIEEGIRNVFE